MDLGAIVISSDPLELSSLKHAGINQKSWYGSDVAYTWHH